MGCDLRQIRIKLWPLIYVKISFPLILSQTFSDQFNLFICIEVQVWLAMQMGKLCQIIIVIVLDLC